MSADPKDGRCWCVTKLPAGPMPMTAVRDQCWGRSTLHDLPVMAASLPSIPQPLSALVAPCGRRPKSWPRPNRSRRFSFAPRRSYAGSRPTGGLHPPTSKLRSFAVHSPGRPAGRPRPPQENPTASSRACGRTGSGSGHVPVVAPASQVPFHVGQEATEPAFETTPSPARRRRREDGVRQRMTDCPIGRHSPPAASASSRHSHVVQCPSSSRMAYPGLVR